jgi:hypothetical protein
LRTNQRNFSAPRTVNIDPAFVEAMFRNILATGKAWGITWWSTNDNLVEHNLGLRDEQNKITPSGKLFAQLVAEFRHSPPAIVPRKSALVIPDRGLSTDAFPPDWRYAMPYMKLIKRGITPTIVIESRSKDVDYLKARGITDLIPLAEAEGVL